MRRRDCRCLTARSGGGVIVRERSVKRDLRMPEAAPAVPSPAEAKNANRITELKVSGHLMTLDSGLFCVFQSPGPPLGPDGSGLPGVRISLPPYLNGYSESVTISTFRQDGWLNARDDAALVRIASGPAQILV